VSGEQRGGFGRRGLLPGKHPTPMPHTFETEQWLPFPRPLVFAFFANPRNLPPLMPAWQHARIDEATFQPPPARPTGTPSFPGVAAGDGTELRITARGVPLLPLRGSWHARIEDFRWNEGFCDVQLKGPFAYWRHCHSVRDAASPEDGQPGTVVRDHVSYALPLEPLSSLALPGMQLALAATFRYRQEQAAKLVAAFAALSARG
jgi:ligand-binding SRPBCC domain-containing protein